MSTATKKVPKENAAPYNLPLRVTSASSFANASVGSAVQADQPQFAVHGEFPLPKLKSEAGCKGNGKAKSKEKFKVKNKEKLALSMAIT